MMCRTESSEDQEKKFLRPSAHVAAVPDGAPIAPDGGYYGTTTELLPDCYDRTITAAQRVLQAIEE